ncbi:MAG: type II toxin-antitoxin system HicB family antitoxin [Candidatus Nanoarchaeia archaeon]
MECKLSAVIKKEGKWFVARGVEIELASQGTSVEEAISNLKEAFELWIKHADKEELEVFEAGDSPIVTQIAATA